MQSITNNYTTPPTIAFKAGPGTASASIVSAAQFLQEVAGHPQAGLPADVPSNARLAKFVFTGTDNAKTSANGFINSFFPRDFSDFCNLRYRFFISGDTSTLCDQCLKLNYTRLNAFNGIFSKLLNEGSISNGWNEFYMGTKITGAPGGIDCDLGTSQLFTAAEPQLLGPKVGSVNDLRQIISVGMLIEYKKSTPLTIYVLDVVADVIDPTPELFVVFDDGALDQYTNAFPVLQAHSIPAAYHGEWSHAIANPAAYGIGVRPSLTPAQMRTMDDSYLIEFGMHGIHGPAWTGVFPWQIINQLNESRGQLLAMGISQERSDYFTGSYAEGEFGRTVGGRIYNSGITTITVDPDSDTITVPSHILLYGVEEVVFSSSPNSSLSGVLPAGIAPGVKYYVYKPGDTGYLKGGFYRFALALSPSDAADGIGIDIETAGSPGWHMTVTGWVCRNAWISSSNAVVLGPDVAFEKFFTSAQAAFYGSETVSFYDNGGGLPSGVAAGVPTYVIGDYSDAGSSNAKVAATPADAAAGNAITLGPKSMGSFYVVVSGVDIRWMIKRRGMKVMRGTHRMGFSVANGVVDPLRIGTWGLGYPGHRMTTIDVDRMLAQLRRLKISAVIYGHRINDNQSDGQATDIAVFDYLCAQLASGQASGYWALPSYNNLAAQIG